MQIDDNGDPKAWRATAPCVANVWDPVVKAYRPCDELADPDSDSDLCTKHQERVMAFVAVITAAQTAARINELEEQPAYEDLVDGNVAHRRP
jgi:hypothetical protein